MKILQINLSAFGPFTDQSLDLSGGSEGLHVIYGPNEAGKSASLRALMQMLYGIPERSSDDFVHPYAKMRIGALLRHSDGAELNARLNRARTARSQRQSLEKQRRKEEGHLQKAKNKIAELGAHLDGLCQEAGCLSYEELPGVEKRSEQRESVLFYKTPCPFSQIIRQGEPLCILTQRLGRVDTHLGCVSLGIGGGIQDHSH